MTESPNPQNINIKTANHWGVFVKNNIITAIKIRMKSDTLLKEDKIIGS